MKINFNQPKYVIPLILFPFTFLIFFVYQDLFGREELLISGEEGLQESLAPPSKAVVDKDLTDKLSAYRQHYRGADGYTAIGELVPEEEQQAQYSELYSEEEKQQLDSIENAFHPEVVTGSLRHAGSQSSVSGPRAEESLSESDRLLLELMTQGQGTRESRAMVQPADVENEDDPLELMRQQYALLDSFQKANDPEYQARKLREATRQQLADEVKRRELQSLRVRQVNQDSEWFNTIKSRQEDSFIKAIIDEQVQGYAGSRVRIRLLEDVLIGQELIGKGTCLYALISGFGPQRVMLNISSVNYQNQLLPVRLSVYDLDGMKGLYVPESAFRDFSRELGSNSIQGMNMSVSSSEEQNQFLMSGMQKAFQSTSQAVAKAIRKNKVRLKYSTMVYLIDDKQFNQSNQSN